MLNEQPNAVLVIGAIAGWKATLDKADKLFTSLDDTALYQEIAPGRNRLIYLWGHLTAMHDRMLAILGISERVHPELDEVFLTSPDKGAELPSAETVRSWWSEVSTKLNGGIDAFSASDWLAKHNVVSDADFAKEPLRNRFSILLSRTNHLSHHLGQAALVRR